MKKNIVLESKPGKKLVKAAGCWILIIFSVITIVSCDSNILNNTSEEYVNINLSTEMPSFARNAVPDAGGYNNLRYRLTGFADNSENEEFIGFWETLSRLTNANILIHTGPWKLILTGYTEYYSDLSAEENAEYIVLQGTVNDILSQSTTISFDLKEIENCKVNGSFEYTVYYPSSGNFAVTASILNAEDLTETDYNSYAYDYSSYTRIYCNSIPSGNYLLKIQFVYTIGEDSFESYTMPLIQIAAGLETEGSRTLSANEVTSFYEINYHNLYDGEMPDGSAEYYTPYKAVVLENPARQNYKFFGWYTSSDWTDENKLPLNADGKYVFNQNHDSEGNTYIYARWLRTYYEEDGFSWSLSDDGVLTISGSGEVPFVSSEEWKNATSVVVEEGITGFKDGSWRYGLFGFSDYYDGRIRGYTSNIKTIELPSTLTSIVQYCFYGCTSLEEINIPDSVTSIGAYAFYDCTALKEITLPSALSSIPSYCFYGCSSLEEINIPDSVTSIGDYAFAYCTGILSIIVPATVTNSFYNSVFTGWRSNQTITLDWNSNDSSHRMPYVNSGAYCTHAKYRNNVYAWNGCTLNEDGTAIVISGAGSAYLYKSGIDLTNVTSITVEEGITSLNCYSTPETNTSVKTVTLPSTLVTLGSQVFRNFAGIETITVPESVTSIGESAFSHCSSLKEITLPSALSSIPSYCFYDCTSLEEIEIPDSITSIGQYAFKGCTSLGEIEIPDSVTSIGSNAFRECSSLASISLPGSLTSIAEYAFYKCTGFTALTIPASVTRIYTCAFDYCTESQTVTLDWNADDTTSRTIADDAFGYAGVIVKYKDGVAYGD